MPLINVDLSDREANYYQIKYNFRSVRLRFEIKVVFLSFTRVETDEIKNYIYILSNICKDDDTGTVESTFIIEK